MCNWQVWSISVYPSACTFFASFIWRCFWCVEALNVRVYKEQHIFPIQHRNKKEPLKELPLYLTFCRWFVLPRAFFPKWLGRFQVCCEEVWPRIWIQSIFPQWNFHYKKGRVHHSTNPPNPPGVIGRGIKTCVFTLISKGFGHCGLCRRAAWWQMWTANGPWILAYGSGSTKRVPKLWQTCFYLCSVASSNGTHALFHYALFIR